MGHRSFHVIRKAVGVGWPLAALSFAIVAVPNMALQANETSQSSPVPQRAAGIMDIDSTAFDSSLVTVNVVTAGRLGESSARQTHVGGQGWHLVYAGQR